MTITTDHETVAPGISTAQVAAYLRAHPEFFVTHPYLLSEITIPHGISSAASLLEYQIKVLRDQNGRSNDRLQSLIDIARDNDAVIRRLHTLTLSLLDTSSLQEALVMLNTSLRHDFSADAVALHLFTAAPYANPEEMPAEFMNVHCYGDDDPMRGELERQFTAGEPFLGVLDKERTRMLFAQRSALAGSVALLPLGFTMSFFPERPPLGVLAIGNRDRNHYTTTMGTLYLKYMGEFVSRILLARLQPASQG
ncbi:MAG: DUF484 family protein [Gammaproteobacteria bacterium]|nr:DUF484 family protein [Gammaproteobacteria bacterium]